MHEKYKIKRLTNTIWKIRDSYLVGRKNRNIFKFSISKGGKPNRGLLPQTRRICPEKDIEKNNHFENIFVSDAEEKSVENNKGNGNNFIAYSVAPETEEGEN